MRMSARFGVQSEKVWQYLTIHYLGISTHAQSMTIECISDIRFKIALLDALL